MKHCCFKSTFGQFPPSHLAFAKKIVLLGALLCSLSVARGQNTGMLSGYVRDARSGEPLVGATVALENTNMGTVTDIDGFFQIDNIPTQTYRITVAYLGYQSQSRFNVVVRSAGNPALNFDLQEAVQQLDEVVVSASSREDMVTPLSSI